MNEILSPLAEGLAGRLRSLAIVLDRLDRLESGSGVWLAHFAEAELATAATEMVLRALRTAGDPTNFVVLKALAEDSSVSLTRLMETTELGRLVLSERLNDLVQVGLASRLIDTDHAQITGAGASLVRGIDALSAEVRAQYRLER